MITTQTIQDKLALWGLQDSTITEIINENTGKCHTNVWAIGKEHVLKVGTDLGGLQTHIDVSKALKEAGFSVSLPVTTQARITSQRASFIIICPGD